MQTPAAQTCALANRPLTANIQEARRKTSAYKVMYSQVGMNTNGTEWLAFGANPADRRSVHAAYVHAFLKVGSISAIETDRFRKIWGTHRRQLEFAAAVDNTEKIRHVMLLRTPGGVYSLSFEESRASRSPPGPRLRRDRLAAI